MPTPQPHACRCRLCPAGGSPVHSAQCRSPVQRSQTCPRAAPCYPPPCCLLSAVCSLLCGSCSCGCTPSARGLRKVNWHVEHAQMRLWTLFPSHRAACADAASAVLLHGPYMEGTILRRECVPVWMARLYMESRSSYPTWNDCDLDAHGLESLPVGALGCWSRVRRRRRLLMRRLLVHAHMPSRCRCICLAA